MLSISKTFEFAASHRLYNPEWSDEKNVKLFCKCFGQHGHNYKLEVTVTGEIHEFTGYIIDASLLDSIVRENVLNDLDHKDLNTAVPWLQGAIPTVEVLIEAIWSRLSVPLEDSSNNRQLSRLVLWETSRIFATRDRG